MFYRVYGPFDFKLNFAKTNRPLLYEGMGLAGLEVFFILINTYMNIYSYILLNMMKVLHV